MDAPRSARKPLNLLMAAGVPKRREGGVAAIVWNLGREIERLGHSVTYVFLEDLIAPGSVSQRLSEAIFSFRLSRYIVERRSQFALVNLHAPTGLAYGLRRRKNRHSGYPPYVMTLHGLEERRVEVMLREAKKGRAWNFGWKNRLWHRFYHFPRFRWAIRNADGAHAYSRDVWNLLQLKYGLPPDRCAYIPNGVEQRFFVAREYRDRDGGGVRLLYPGTWLDQRGIFYLRDALREAARRVPGLTLTVAGAGAPAEEILRFFGDELKSRIIVRPVVAAEDMPALYREHDVLVFPSLMEGLPGVLLEAMASGMPVLTTETCGMPDVVQDGVNGMLIPPADAGALERAILCASSSVDLRRKLGQAARETMERYTWENSARKLEALFFRVLAEDNEDFGAQSEPVVK